MPSPPSRHPGSAPASARLTRWAAGGAAALFIAWLIFPLAYGRLRPAPGRGLAAGREAAVAERPARNGRPLADFLRDYSRYYERSTSIRPLVLPRYLAFKLYALGMSTVSSVVVGRDRWLFMGSETTRIDELRYFLGTNLFREETLARWLQVLTERRRWLEQRGIAYWLVVAPNKSTIYPEYMPEIYPRGRRTRLDQLAEMLGREAPGFPVIDLRPALRAGKKERLIYWPTDTHWNDLGRYLAYREILRRLGGRFPALEAIPEDAFTMQPCHKYCHDLEDLLLLPWDVRGPFFQLVPERPVTAVPVRGEASAGVASFRSRAGVVPLALIIHDSFGDTLKPLLASHFRRSRWILDRTHALPTRWIERKRPRLVIEEIVERYLEEDPWPNPAEIRD